MNDDNTELVVANTSSGAEQLAAKVPKAHVVAAFQTVPSEVLFGVFEAQDDGTLSVSAPPSNERVAIA